MSEQLSLSNVTPLLVEPVRRKRLPRRLKDRTVARRAVRTQQIAGIRAGTLQPGDPAEPHIPGTGTAGIVHRDMKPDNVNPCTSEPGLCMVLTCRLNLIADVSVDGRLTTIRISRPGGHSLKIPPERTNKGKLKAWKMEAAADAVAVRAEQLMLRFGSTCARDIRAKDFYELADAMGGTRQRAQQIEASAMRRAKLECQARGIEWTAPAGNRTFQPEPFVRDSKWAPRATKEKRDISWDGTTGNRTTWPATPGDS